MNDKYKLESLQGDGSRTRQAIPQNARWKARACNNLQRVINAKYNHAFHMRIFYLTGLNRTECGLACFLMNVVRHVA